jgi:hypothetical protein
VRIEMAHAGFGEGHPKTRGDPAGGRRMPTLRNCGLSTNCLHAPGAHCFSNSVLYASVARTNVHAGRRSAIPLIRAYRTVMVTIFILYQAVPNPPERQEKRELQTGFL